MASSFARSMASSADRSVEGIFNDFISRRCGLIKALTTDVEEFYRQCDPEKENLCLYGFPDETWRVTLPEEEVPPELPEPALGINFARDGMQRRDWLSLIAVHSDAWLMSVAFFLGASLDKKERNRLFQMINNLPTVLDVVAGRVKIAKEDKSSINNPFPKKLPKTQPLRHSDDEYEEDSSDAYQEEEDEEYGGDDQDNTTCGLCGGYYGPKEFWICCDICQKWYHGKCVKITPAKAEHIKQYKCPLCSNKRPRAVGV